MLIFLRWDLCCHCRFLRPAAKPVAASIVLSYPLDALYIPHHPLTPPSSFLIPRACLPPLMISSSSSFPSDLKHTAASSFGVVRPGALYLMLPLPKHLLSSLSPWDYLPLTTPLPLLLIPQAYHRDAAVPVIDPESLPTLPSSPKPRMPRLFLINVDTYVFINDYVGKSAWYCQFSRSCRSLRRIVSNSYLLMPLLSLRITWTLLPLPMTTIWS